MAIVQTQAQVVDAGRKVGILDERGVQIKALGATALTVADLRRVMNSIGFYDEHADRLVAAGTLTFA